MAEVKAALLKSVGATPISFGQKLHETTSETLRHKTSVQIIEHLNKLAHGWLMDADSLDAAKFIIVKTTLRRCIPHNGIVFMEGKDCNSWKKLTENLESWMSTRMEGDYMKIPGQSSKSEKKNEFKSQPVQHSHHKDGAARNDLRPMCSVCGKIGHK